MSNIQGQLFAAYNHVKGTQRFLKEAGLLKYANENAEELDANSVAQAMVNEGMNAPVDKAVDDNTILEVANTLIDLAQNQDPHTQAAIEDAVEQVADAVGAENKQASIIDAVASEVGRGLPLAAKIAEQLRKRAEETNQPAEVIGVSKVDYQRASGSNANAAGTGTTTLDTAKGEIGKQDNVESKIVDSKGPEAPENQNSEGQDIHKKDYTAPGKGGTDLKTEKGIIGTETNVEGKLAKLAMQATLAKIFNK